MTRNFVVSRAAGMAILGLRIAWMYGALWAWNRLLFGDDDDELLPYDRANPHVLLGRNPDGSIRVFRNVGAMGDFLEWFGLNELPALMKKYGDKQIEPGEIVSEMARAPLEKAVGSMRPDIKGAVEVLSGQTWFPEPLQPRSVRRGESVASVFGLGDEYKLAAGKILDDGQRPRRHYWQRWFFGVTDPRAAALSEIYDLRSSFLKKKGSEEAGVFPDSKYKEARDAAINENYDAFVEWKKKFVKEHGTNATDKFIGFLNRVDPVASRLKDSDEVEFEHEYLTSEQRQKLAVARQYAGELHSTLFTWWDASGGAPGEKGEIASARETIYGREAFKIASIANLSKAKPEDKAAQESAVAYLKGQIQKGETDVNRVAQVLRKKLKAMGWNATPDPKKPYEGTAVGNALSRLRRRLGP